MFATVSISAVTQSTAPDTVDEPRSGTPFPLSLTPPGGTTPHWLMGTAIRQRTLFRVKIYAFGLYVDPEGARASLSRFAPGRKVSLPSRPYVVHIRLTPHTCRRLDLASR